MLIENLPPSRLSDQNHISVDALRMELSLGVEVYESYKVLNFEILSISQLSLGSGRMPPVGIDTLNSPVIGIPDSC